MGMAINLEISQIQLKESKNHGLNLHYLPATISGEGAANVENYFNQYTTNENGILRNALRGYPLQGNDFKVPPQYKGVVFQETQKPLDENANRVFKVTGTFDRLTYWNYDKIPSRGDAFQQAWDYVDLAESMCTDITEEDIEKELKERIKSDPA